MASGGAFISRTSARRLARDVKDIMTSPLESDGIYYVHDQEDMLKGYAMIIGPEETVYEDGFYLFTFDFKPDYPAQPPVVKYWTNDGHTRFNPNLYKGGKVCVSILNTWKGEQWTGCQTIRSVLLALCTLLNDNPLLNEPGVSPTHPDVASYRRIIEFKNIQWAMIKQLYGIQHYTVGEVVPVQDWGIAFFGEKMREHFLKRLPIVMKRVRRMGSEYHDEDNEEEWKSFRVQCKVYNGMWATIDYRGLLDSLSIIGKELAPDRTEN
jgi:ubiquitin-protein ligase